MAGIPMYYGIPTSGEVEAEMARNKMDVLKTQEKSIELDELMKAKELIKQEATKKLAEAKAAKVAPTPIPESAQSVSGYNQPAVAKPAEATPMPSYETANTPSGEVSPMPSFMKGADTEARAKEPMMDETKPAQDQTAIEGYRQPQQEAAPQQEAKQEVPQTPITRVKQANLDYKEAYDQVESAYKTAELFKQNGLLLQWQKQLKVAEDLESTRTMAQERRIKSTKDLMELTGGIAGGYVAATKRTNDPVELERAWQQSLMLMETNGLPVGNLRFVTDPKQRLAIAQTTEDSATNASLKLKLEMEALKEKGRNDRAQASLDLRQDLGEKRLKQQARSQEAIQMRFDQNMDFKERSFAEGRIKTIVTQAQRDRSELNSELDDLNYKLSGIRSGQIMVDRAGNKLTKESRMQEIADIQKDINRITTQRDDISDEIKSYELKFKDLGKAAKVKEGAPSDTTTSESKVPTPERIAKVQEYVKAYPDQAATIKANWEREYPNVKFEDAIKGKVTVSNPDYKGNVKFEALSIAQLEDYIKRYPKDDNIDYIKKLIEAKKAAEKTANASAIGK